MNKRNIIITLFTISFLFSSVYAFRLLTKKVALNKVLPDVENIIEETRTLSAVDKEELKNKLNGITIFHQEGSQSSIVKEKNEYTFYFGMKNGKKIGVAVVEKQPGKWGPVEYIIALDATNGKVINVAVMSYTERRGRPIARKNFLKQFIGKKYTDPLKIRKDIRGITGATISSAATCFAIKKISALYEILFLNEKVEKLK